MAARSAFLIGFTIALLIVGSHAFITRKVGDADLKFTYSGATGPDKWASLNPKFFLCAKGKSQSPIDIVTDKVVVSKKLKPLIRNYHAANVTLVNYKFTVGIEYPDHTGGIIVGDKEYKLKQMHWHSPSEHRINGIRYAAEQHMVHISDDGQIAVVATLFKYGHPDPVLSEVHSKLNELASNNIRSHEAGKITIGPFYPKELRQTSRKYYRYIGSSSIPPCSENLMYLVLGKARSISREQVESLKAPLDMRCKNNARPCQPLNGRHVEVYEDHIAP
ncbi:Carbonic anhydrase [Handroanthus impetiginosus]|uniref:Carbonic anhydrase n=1 Tax=Handroanthus impetiginosus TaxID=429701 RepID=A0A2G9HPP7_9LAMI|nr:Carbonic anhydrase [Handroanthus impetiginosus]